MTRSAWIAGIAVATLAGSWFIHTQREAAKLAEADRARAEEIRAEALGYREGDSEERTAQLNARVDAAIKQLNDPSIAPKGNPWKIWLNRLAEIVAEVKSSSGEGDDESKVDHPFVQFIRELQNCLPAEYQRDQAALAEALLEARSKPRNKNKS